MNIPNKLFCAARGEPFEWGPDKQVLPSWCVGCEHFKGNCLKVMQDRVARNLNKSQLWFSFGEDK